MGNKSSSNKDPHFNSESRGRSRSFNGIASRFRKASKSPPRVRSSSFGEAAKLQRKESGNNGQNMASKLGQNGHVTNKWPDVPKAQVTKSESGAAIPVANKTDRRQNRDNLAPLSQSAPSRQHFHYHYSSPIKQMTTTALQSTPSKTPLDRNDSQVPKNSFGNTSKALKYNEKDTIIKSSNLRNLKNKKLSESGTCEIQKPALIENYAESPHLSVAHIQNVSHKIFSEKLEDLAKRRGKATLNRDLSISNASLGLLSNRSKSMHSLCSHDWDYEERCKVSELLSFQESSKVGELCQSITSQFSSENHENEDCFMCPLTNSTSSIDMEQYPRKHITLEPTSVEIKRNLASQYAIDPKKSSKKSISSSNVRPDVIQAKRMLLAHVLKNQNPSEMCKNSSQTHLVSLQKRASSPNILVNENKSLAPSSFKHSQGLESSVASIQGGSLLDFTNQFCSGSSISKKSLSSSGLCGQVSKKMSHSQMQAPNAILKNVSMSQLLAANMTKSMQKFVLDNQKVSVSSTDYEKLHNKIQSKKTNSGICVRSSSFSVLSSKQKQQHFVQQMIQEQQVNISQQQAEPDTSVNGSQVIHIHSKSYNSTPVSTGDSGFRSRSQSWSSLSHKSVSKSQQEINSVNNPISNLWSYSEISLAESHVIPALQTQRYISVLYDEGPLPVDLNLSHDLYAMQNLGIDSSQGAGALSIAQSQQHLPQSDVCPTCNLPFDKGKKRKLIDQCGHERCWTCMFSTRGECPLCSNSARMLQYQHYQQPPAMVEAKVTTPYSASNLPPSVKTYSNQHAVSPPFQLEPSYSSNTALVSLDNGAKGQGHDPYDLAAMERQTGLLKAMAAGKVDKHEPSSPPPDVAHGDLMTQFGLLSSNRSNSPERLSHNHKSANQTRDETYSFRDGMPDRIISDTSPMSTLTASSGSDKGQNTVHPAYGAPHHSRDPSSDSIVSITSVSTRQSLSPHATSVRPHSITTLTPGTIEDLNLFNRKSQLRRSARATIGVIEDSKVLFTPIRPPQLHLIPLDFEVPHAEGTPIFIGREWIYRDIDLSLNGDHEITSDQPSGIIIAGGLGNGKTAIIEQLVAHSSFGVGKTGLVQAPLSRQGTDRLHKGVNYGPTSASNQNLSGSNTSLNYDSLRTLGAQVVAYHYCQADVNVTCMVPEFVHSLAAYLAHAPQLLAYRELLLQDPQLQQLLSLQQCVQSASNSFVKGILEPLDQLKQNGKVEADTCIIVIDALNEAEFHKPDYGDTITSFIVDHINMMPRWLKLVLTLYTNMIEIMNLLPFPRIYIDKVEGNDMLIRDLQEYVIHRVQSSVHIKRNMALKTLDASTMGKFASYVQGLSKGSFLFCKQTLDLIEQGHVVLKSSNYKILPITLSEVFMLYFNIKFPSVRSFEKVSPILEICLASLYPLSAHEIFHALNSGFTDRYVNWEDFQQRLGLISGLLYQRKDKTFVFFHPSFREWLIRRDNLDTNTKFLCDLRHGHGLLALYLSRVVAPLSADKTVELGHHILKAHIYKNIGKQRGYLSCDMQAFWLALSSENLNASLVSPRNLYSPNVKVSRLILLSGANPNTRTSYDDNSPILCVDAKERFPDMVSLLLEFNAYVDAVSDTGMSALCYAASSGHAEIIKTLHLRQAAINHIDNSGQCAVVHAAVNGHLDALVYLLQCDWTSYEGHITKVDAMQQSFIVAAAMGHKHVCEYLLHLYRNLRERFGLDVIDTLLGETPLTAACLHGQKDIVLWLLDRGASCKTINLKSFTPLLCAVEAGKWEIVDLLLTLGSSVEQTDKHGQTPLMIAAYKGHIRVLEMLLARGASIHKTDKEGLTALCWGCLKGHLCIIQYLLDHGSNLHHADRCGRSPLQLAAFHGDVRVVQYLIDQGAQIEHADLNEMRALDQAIDRRNIAVIMCFLRKGAKLSQMTWAVAAGKPDVMLLLLNKLMEDGNILYKKNCTKEAAQRYQYALNKFPQEEFGEDFKTFMEIKLNLMLNLSRCKRKMNDCDGAIKLATTVLELKPNCFEAYYARARAKRDARLYSLAIEDLKEALKLAPTNHELQRLLMRVRDECQEQAKFSISPAQTQIKNLNESRLSNETAL